MKKIILAFFTVLVMSGCSSISAEGRYGSISLKNQSYFNTKKSTGNAYGHNNPNNPHYKKY
ncbi:membrane lipoprotein lipid attachment site-containing protein [Ilyobacter polytropus]|uniref:Lipoprotein n=1 Tax=Ilyobacter polytropus (strain ATCC 51220 / DSM 2926 / LMG 16218 / CuHBu1) TaxID=572544 RepID=E3H773_ILYPC|nr:membrane lipoprotein lipid attachment site-containing protein [Ilyobacter polytropus]ADO82554.1 hypothetical protein Ilyop_0768 [Ilyobacter polytropus DSM 2926]